MLEPLVQQSNSCNRRSQAAAVTAGLLQWGSFAVHARSRTPHSSVAAAGPASFWVQHTQLVSWVSKSGTKVSAVLCTVSVWDWASCQSTWHPVVQLVEEVMTSHT